MALIDVIKDIQGSIRELTGVRGAADYPPDALPATPFSVAYRGPGAWMGESSGWGKRLHDVIVEIHKERQDLARDIQTLEAIAELIPPALLADITLGDTCETFGDIEESGIIPGEYNGIQTVLIRFTLKDVKIHWTV